MQQQAELKLARQTKILEKSAAVPLRPPQIQYDLVWDEGREAVLGGLQAYSMAHDA
jgi:hypothetical protein